MFRIQSACLAASLAAVLGLVPAYADDPESAQDPLVYEGDLGQGIDSALIAGWSAAVKGMSLDGIPEVNPRTAGEALSAAAISDGRLSLTFDPQKLQSQLQAAGHATWSGLREPVLMWLADVDDGAVVGGGSEHAFAVALSQAAQQDRFELMFPLMDLDDVQAVNANAILTHNDDALKSASKRYDPTFYVAGALKREGEGLAFKWNVYDGSGKALGNGESAGTLEEVSAASANAIAHVFMDNVSADSSEAAGSENAVKAAQTSLELGPGEGFVRILFSGVKNIQDLGAIRRSLITFGYEATSAAVGWLPEGVVFEVPNSASPAILDGTLAHADGFSKTGNWTYAYGSSLAPVTSGRDGLIGARSYESATSAYTRVSRAAPARPAASGGVTVETGVPLQIVRSALVED